MGVINITLTSVVSDDVFPIEMDDSQPLSKLRETIHTLFGVDPAQQEVILNGKHLQDSPSVAAASIVDGDMLMMMPKQQPAPAGTNPQVAEARRMMNQIASTPGALEGLRAQNPAIAQAIEVGSVQSFINALQNGPAAGTPAAEHIDPLDPEAQRKMFERIQQKNVDDNYELAMEHSPEVFGSVTMLYVDMAVNGEPLKVFIDSGAQMTIMTQPCAEKCGIMRLMDTRFQGMAVGVGSNKILGRIHVCPMKVGAHHISTSVTILEQKSGPQCIFGLDNLKRHQCCIDLLNSVLSIGSCGDKLPFLAEHEVPETFNIERQRSSEAKDELDGSSLAPETVEGDTSVLSKTASLPPTPRHDGAGTSDSVAPQRTGDTAAKQLQEMTGRPIEECITALQLCNNDMDRAASYLMGW